MVPAATRPSTGRTCDSGTSTAVSVVGGVQPALSAAAVTSSAGAPSSRSTAIRSSSRWRTRPVVSVSSVWPATRGRGQLVDVGEDQLGEVGEHVGGQAVADRDRGQLPPRDPGADPERREQRVGGAAAARLAAAELVAALDGRGGGGAQVLGAAPAGQGEEAAERELDGVADRLAHGPREGVAIARHLVDDRRHDVVGDAGELAAHLLERGGGQLEAVVGGAAAVLAVHGASLSPANKCDVVVHVHWS